MLDRLARLMSYRIDRPGFRPFSGGCSRSPPRYWLAALAGLELGRGNRFQAGSASSRNALGYGDHRYSRYRLTGVPGFVRSLLVGSGWRRAWLHEIRQLCCWRCCIRSSCRYFGLGHRIQPAVWQKRTPGVGLLGCLPPTPVDLNLLAGLLSEGANDDWLATMRPSLARRLDRWIDEPDCGRRSRSFPTQHPGSGAVGAQDRLELISEIRWAACWWVLSIAAGCPRRAGRPGLQDTAALGSAPASGGEVRRGPRCRCSGLHPRIFVGVVCVVA